MTHRFRYWKCYPPTSASIERRRISRVVATCLSVGLVLCAIAIVILFVFVLNLKAHRDQSTVERDRAIRQAMCSALSEFHSTSPDLAHARVAFHCPTRPLA